MHSDHTPQIHRRLVDVIEDDFSRVSPVQITAVLLQLAEEYTALAKELSGERDEV